jgi:hypothetical protein
MSTPLIAANSQPLEPLAASGNVADAPTAPTDSQPLAPLSHVTAEREGREALARVRIVWWYSLGGLWILDALLQAQPIMFTTMGLAGNVVLPAAQGQPHWIAAPMLWAIGVWERHPAAWNGAAVGLELLTGGLLLVGRRWPSWGRAGLLLSIGWGLIVWYFGEGLGGLFMDSPTYLAGAPGSALLYVLLASALLLPESVWTAPRPRLLRGLQVGVGALWGIGGLLQLAPLYWSPLGLASVLQNVAMMPLPFGLGALDAQLVASMANAPVLWNAALSALLLGPAVALLVGRGGKALCVFAGGWLLIVWVVFQGCGMVFSRMSTDPNTPLLWALLLLPVWFAARRRPAARPASPP